MTDPLSQRPTIAAGVEVPVAALPAVPPLAPGAAGAVAGAVPVVPDDAVMIREIDRDRRHERYLLRAALVACIVIAIALAIRLVWG